MAQVLPAVIFRHRNGLAVMNPNGSVPLRRPLRRQIITHFFRNFLLPVFGVEKESKSMPPISG